MHQTLLDVFVEHLANPDVKERHAVECGDESWTYEDLDIISTGLALEIEAAYGARPTVAIIAENLPYTFALILAVWKLRGIVAPIDYHTPENLLQPMLKKISPSCVAVPSTEKRTQQVVLGRALFLPPRRV
jgi:acyl-CoA synthetase (AMP-forming)/AMP-acid ligase II